MSEKKYYVKSVISCEPYTSDADKGWLTSASNDSATWIYKKYRNAFTKSELSEIKDGMFLKRIPGGTPLDDLGKDKSYYVWLDDCNYWINPLIELVPVEDGKWQK